MILSAVVTVITSAAFLMLFSAIIYFFGIDRKFIPLFSTLSAAAGCFAGAFAAAVKIKEKGYLIGLIIGAVWFFVITVISIILGSDGVTLNSLFHLLIILLSGMTGGMAGVNRGSKKII